MRKLGGLAAVVISIASLTGCNSAEIRKSVGERTMTPFAPSYTVKKTEPVVISQNQEPEPISYRLNSRWGLSLDIEPVYKRKRNR